MPKIVDSPALKAHIAQYRSDPIAAHDWDTTGVGRAGIIPCLLLTTTGQKTGEKRSIPLLYQPAGDGFIVVGSLKGGPEHPQWYLNLMANPDCEVHAGKFAYKALAETVEGEWRGLYWDLATRVWPGYLDYEAGTDRQIPIVLLRTSSVQEA